MKKIVSAILSFALVMGNVSTLATDREKVLLPEAENENIFQINW